jgi:hypothetical protein
VKATNIQAAMRRRKRLGNQLARAKDKKVLLSYLS